MAILETAWKKNASSEQRIAAWHEALATLRDEAAIIRLGGGEKSQAKQRARGKMLARERVEALCDPGTFEEIGLWVGHGMYAEYGGAPAGGVVVGTGTIHQREVMVISNDATVKAGAWFPMTGKKNLFWPLIVERSAKVAKRASVLDGTNISSGRGVVGEHNIDLTVGHENRHACVGIKIDGVLEGT